MRHFYTLVTVLIIFFTNPVNAGTEQIRSGDYSGTAEFSGVIIFDNTASSVWQWKSGGYTGFQNSVSDLTEEGTRLSVKAPHDLLLLGGRSAHAFEGSDTVGAGIIPTIQLAGSDGVPVSIQWTKGTPGEGLIFLPVTVSEDSQRTGTLTMQIQAFGSLAWSEYDGYGARITQTLGNNAFDAYVFNGGVPGMNTWSTRNGLDFIARMTGSEVTADLLWQQLRDVVPSLPATPNIVDESGYQDLIGTGWFYSGAYALGVPSGANLNLHFSSPITGRSVWRAGLTITVSYA